jgi:hypothetical protein
MVRCQFCGADVSQVPRPVAQAQVHRGYDAPKWVWIWYTIISMYWVLDGAFQMLAGMGLISDTKSVVGIILGAISIVIGLGLLFKIRFLRGVAHILCWLNLANGLLGLLAGLMLTVAIGPLAYILCLFAILRAASAAFMIYLIGETESHYPM